MLAPWKKSYDQYRQHIKKQSHYFANKGSSSQSYGFSIAMYGWESWTIRKVEHWKMDTFELWCWRRLFRVPWTVRRSNQSIVKEISPEYSLEGQMMKPKLQYFGHLCEELTHWKRPWCWEGLGAGGEGDSRGWDGGMASLAGWHHCLDGRESEWTPGVGDGQGGLACCHSWGHKESDTERLNWTEWKAI